MGFLTPKMPKAPPPPDPLPPPIIEDTQARGQQEAAALRKRQGRASTVLAGKTDMTGGSAVNVATKTLLGG